MSETKKEDEGGGITNIGDAPSVALATHFLTSTHSTGLSYENSVAVQRDITTRGNRETACELVQLLSHGKRRKRLGSKRFEFCREI